MLAKKLVKKSKVEVEDEDDQKKKKNLFAESSDDDSSHESDDEVDMEALKNLNSKSKGFSDDNAKWLKVKKTKQDEEEEEDSSEAEDSDEESSGSSSEELEIEKQSRKREEKLKKIQVESKKELQEVEMDLVSLPSGDQFRTDMMTESNVTEVKERIDSIRFILDDFKNRKEPEKTRSEYIQQLITDISVFYGYTPFLADLILKLFKINEALEFIQANETARPLVIRVNTLKTTPKDLIKNLKGRGANVSAIKWCDIGLQVFDSNVRIGATPEYLAGHYMQQSASSFCPVIALNPQENERVLDMCAAPGGKTTHIAQMMKNTGTLWANDISRNRILSLKANMHRHGAKANVISSYNGVLFQSLTPNYFNRVLVDAPCTGTGVISKDPSVKSSKTLTDFLECTKIQKDLILCAIDAVNAKSPDPIIVYSTCSISVQENEAIVDFALKQRHVKLVDTGLPFGTPGFVNHESGHYDQSLKLTRRYYPHTHNMDGFFVAKLKKLSNNIPQGATQQVKGLQAELNRLKQEKDKQREDDRRRRKLAKERRDQE